METTANFSLDEMPPITSWLSDMDGVLVSEERAIDGAQEFIDTMHELNFFFIVLSNN